MIRKVKQFVAGMYANSADINMKKAKNAAREAAAYKKEQVDGYYARHDLIPGSNITYGAMIDVQEGRASRKTKKANRQYAKADKLMGY